MAERDHLSWGVCEEIALHGLRYEDGGPYDPRPDVMVLAQPLPSGGLAAVSVAEVGAPLLIVEVAGRSTEAHDIGEKRHAYAAIGVAEYVVFDPDGSLLPAPLMAWRLASGLCTVGAGTGWLVAERGIGRELSSTTAPSGGTRPRGRAD